MAEFVNDGALLRHYQQQPEAQRFNHVSHSKLVWGPQRATPEPYQNSGPFAAFVADSRQCPTHSKSALSCAYPHLDLNYSYLNATIFNVWWNPVD